MIKFDECGKFEFEKNFVHMSRHLRYHELILMRKGILYIAEDEEMLAATEGDVIFLTSARHHYGYKPSPGPVEFYWLHFTTDDPREIDFPLITHFDNPTSIIHLFHQLFNFAELSSFDADCATALLLHGAKQEIIGKNFPHLSLGIKVCKWIESHFSKNITVQSIADEFGYSADYISLKVKEKTGMSAKNYISNCRILCAKQILLCSDLSIEEISRQCGFNDSKTFTRTFKKLEGISPTQYRSSFPNAQNIGISIKRASE